MKEKTIPVTLRLDEDQIVDLKKISRTMSCSLQKDISYTDLIRCAIKNFLVKKGFGKEKGK